MVHPVVEVVAPDRSPVLVVVQRRLEVGREGTDLVVGDPTVSRRHLALIPVEGRVAAEDLGSSNGTELAGRPLTGRATLAPGDALVLGDTTIRLAPLTATAPPAEPSPDPGATARGTVVRSAPAEPTAKVRPAPSTSVRATSIDLVADRVRSDESTRHEVAELEAETGGTLTFAFSDIESSTELAERMGDAGWFETLTAHNTIIEGLVGDHGGTVIKSVGDGFMLTFPGATGASRCAIAIQRAITEHSQAQPDRAVRVRVGLHTGEAIAAGGDLFGTHVNMAARVANLAEGGQILVSSITRAIAQSAGDLAFGEEHGVTLKGLAGTHTVSELLWEPVTPEGRSPSP